MKIRKLLAIGMGTILLMASGITVMAASDIDLNNIESIIYDQNGEQIIKYEDIYYEPTSIISNSQNAEGDSIFALFQSAPNYKYTLGGYNSNSFARAQSTSDRAIDSMYVGCGAYRDIGTVFIGFVSNKNPSGTSVKALSATVTPVDFGLDYKVGSAYSQHQFECSGYKGVNKSLHWER